MTISNNEIQHTLNKICSLLVQIEMRMAALEQEKRNYLQPKQYQQYWTDTVNHPYHNRIVCDDCKRDPSKICGCVRSGTQVIC